MKKIVKYSLIVTGCIIALPIILILLYILLVYIGDYRFEHQFESRKSISKITCVEFPSFHIVQKNAGNKSFNGDFENVVHARFDEMPDDSFYDSIAVRSKLIDVKGIEGNFSSWCVNGNNYSYNRIWGNGMPAPPTQDDDQDVFLVIGITRGVKDFGIRYGMW